MSLFFLDRSKKDYKAKVKAIIGKLGAAGLHLNVGKSKFSIKKTKYLQFIIEAGKGISIDLDKIAAIKAQEPLKLVKGIRSFIRFANFYRQFI